MRGIRLRGSLLRDVQAGFSYGRAQPPGVAPQPSSPTPVEPIGPEVIRTGSVGGQHFFQVRNVIQIPFDDSIDGTHALECFFQMPTNTVKISSAKVWVQKRAFRRYVSASSSSSAGGSHGHGSHAHDIPTSNSAVSDSTGSSAHTTDAQGAHTHGTPTHAHTTSDVDTAGDVGSGNTSSDSAGTTGVSVEHSHNVNSHTHTHSHSHGGHVTTATNLSLVEVDSPAHTHPITTNLTTGIFESGGTGNLTLYVADDGSTYGTAIVGPTASDISAQDITSQLTNSSGDKRIKITASALMRVQVLVMLDLLVGVSPDDVGGV